MQSGNILSGTVYYSDLTPVAGAWVSLYDPTEKTTYYAITDSNGHYAITAPADNDYVFDVWFETTRHGPISPIDLSTGDITGYDVTLSIPPP